MRLLVRTSSELEHTNIPQMEPFFFPFSFLADSFVSFLRDGGFRHAVLGEEAYKTRM